MRRLKRLLCTALILFSPVEFFADSFGVSMYGIQIPFEIINKEQKTVRLLRIKESFQSFYGSHFELPSEIELGHSGIMYTVTEIGYGAFAELPNLETVTLPETITLIDMSAFEKCKKLKQIVIPTNVKELGYSVFRDCESLESVTMNDSLEVIGNLAFMNCYNLKEITLPSNIKKIGTNYFYDSDGITTIYSRIKNPASVEVDNYTFRCGKFMKLYVPKGTRDLYLNTQYWNLFGEIIEMGEETGIHAVGNERNHDVYYNIQGFKTNPCKAGIYIKRDKDNRIIKVLKK